MECILGPSVQEIVYTGHKVEGQMVNGELVGGKPGEDTSLPSEGIAICFSQQNPNSVVQWFIDVYAWLPQGRFRLGGLITNTITVDIDPSRIVGFASCPGVIGWSLIVGAAVDGIGFGDRADIFIQGGKCCGGGSPYGVTMPPGGSTGGNPGGGDGGGTGRQGEIES